ncbi:MAG TPA: PDZ domain-containing protein [Longimicrobiaceae bacterium]|nr:PDZ domain-containing protein [Longimicrobiaceae bacterium]
MRITLVVTAALLVQHGVAHAQTPLRHPTEAVDLRFSRAQPVIHYTLRVDSADLGGFAVEMRIRNAPDSLRLAMSAHPEYDDRYWRYLEGLRIESPAGGAAITRVDSAVWRVSAPGGASVVRYRIRLPVPQETPRGAWRPFLAPTGGLVGGPHAFMYVVGQTLIPSHVTLDLPANWQVATGLTPTSDPRTFFAPTADALVEGPMLVGHQSTWRFAIDGVPHRVVYWRGADAVPFDSVEFVRGIRLMAEQAVAVFGRPPWREYTFLFQDGAYGGLEHANSVTLGAPSADLALDPHAYLRETAHEFFHAWNLMRIRPAEYRTVDFRVQPPTAGLWFSEGLTIFYADLLPRRAGLPVHDSTRAAHLQTIIASYFGSSGNSRISAERVSRAAYNAEPDALGDYSASTHLQGEVIGAMLDLVIRDATDGRRSMDDVMRLMLDRFSGERGFLGADVEATVEEVCGCDVTPFFDAHVRGGSPIDFDRHLALIGLRARVSTRPAVDREGAPIPDLGVWGYERAADRSFRLRVSSPDNAWARAGLHTGDRLVSVNGTAVATWAELRPIVRRARIGDTVRVTVDRPSGRFTAAVVVPPLVQPAVTLEPLPAVTERTRRIAREWEAGSTGRER